MGETIAVRIRQKLADGTIAKTDLEVSAEKSDGGFAVLHEFSKRGGFVVDKAKERRWLDLKATLAKHKA